VIKEFDKEGIQLFMNEWIAATMEVVNRHNLIMQEPSIKASLDQLDVNLSVTSIGGQDLSKLGLQERETITSESGHICEIIPFPTS